MPKKPVICNNTPLVALWSIGYLNLLHDLYGEILIPPYVHEEFLGADRQLRQDILDKSPWIKRTPLSDPRQARVYIGLDRGEAQVLALAIGCSPRLVIMDERKGRLYAKRLELPLTGTLGVLLAAKDKKLVVTIKPLIEQLLQQGLFLAPNLVNKVLELAGERE